ncbi:MAG: hypothetical protein CM15mP128_4040 [Methanobacteriota archaeon]|nr:MAG: hypothetical protein CM15mP128_4040 [Euryarchaeota archaeon]
MPLHLIWAEDEAGASAKTVTCRGGNGTDLQRFKALTLGHAVVMGRRTWESLPFPSRAAKTWCSRSTFVA